jgi:stalled ribosome rescue protein Dom34
MPTFHAVAWLDHQSAHILQFDTEHIEAQRVKAHTHHTRQHGSLVRSEHEYFGQVCGALEGIPEILVTGSKTTIADFRHYVEKHRPALKAHILDYETIDHSTDRQLVATAREYFLKADRMRGTPTTG